jgi:hypothetical protein
MFGTLTLADLLSTSQASTVAKVGLEQTFAGVQTLLTAYNNITNEQFSKFVEKTTDEMRRYGGGDTMVMEDADETTVPRAQKVTAGATVGFPLNSTMLGIQWTEMWFRKHTIQELQAQMDAAMAADQQRLSRDLKRALFYSANYTHTDHLARGIDLAVKRLVNADSQPIPPGPNGETFTASSHTHYIGRVGGSLAATDLDALILLVREHYATGEIEILINQAQEAAVRLFTGFVGYPDPRLVQSTAAVGVRGGLTLDPNNYYNRAIGLYNGAEIVVKPWIPANYLYAWNRTQPKPLCYRYDPDYGDGLNLVKNEDQYPWQARAWRRVFGFGVWNRINGASLYIGGTSYTNPTLN